MRKAVLFVSVNLIGVVMGAVGVSYVGAQEKPPSVTRTELLRKPISGIAEKEGVMFVADVPPGAVAGRHFHPGDELIYILQGTMVFEPHGAQPFQLKTGEATYNPAKHIHNARNASSTEPAKVLNCMLAEKGQPLAVAAP